MAQRPHRYQNNHGPWHSGQGVLAKELPIELLIIADINVAGEEEVVEEIQGIEPRMHVVQAWLDIKARSHVHAQESDRSREGNRMAA